MRTADVVGHIHRVLNHARRLESSVESAVQLHFSATAYRTNQVMRTLTAITAVFLPLTLIATLSASLLMAVVFVPTRGAALGRRFGPPGRQSSLGGGNGPARFSSAAIGHLGEYFAGSRVGHRKRFAGIGADPFAVYKSRLAQKGGIF